MYLLPKKKKINVWPFSCEQELMLALRFWSLSNLPVGRWTSKNALSASERG